MGGLSGHAELLADLARQEAKRRSHTSVEPCHLVCVLLARDAARAGAVFPAADVAENERRLQAVPTGMAAPTMSPHVDELLSTVGGPGTEWDTLASRLHAWLDGPPAPVPVVTVTGAGTSSATASGATPPSTTGTGQPARGDAPPVHAFAQVLASADHLASVLPTLPPRAGSWPWATDGARALVLDDLAAVTAAVIGADGTVSAAERSATDAFFTAEGLAGPLGEMTDPVTAAASSPLLHALGTADARSYAVGLVDAARWLAAVDGTPTPDEAARVDALTIALRNVLLANAETAPPTTVAIDALDALVGLTSVKAELRRRLEWYELARLRRRRGLPVADQSMHMAFLGSPGTGKTMVARIFGQALAERGFLRTGHVVEADRSKLVSKYLGGTSHAVHDVVEQARGGVLFLDEAYTLANAVDAGGGDQYDREAVDTLIKLMEDLRDDLVVILAGYRQPMQRFLDMNEGLRSRVPTLLDFPDYDLDELVLVLQSLAGTAGNVITPDALAVFRSSLAVLRTQPGFANGRTVRNLFEEAQRRQAVRLAPLGGLVTDAELATIEAADAPVVTAARSASKDDGADDAAGYL